MVDGTVVKSPCYEGQDMDLILAPKKNDMSTNAGKEFDQKDRTHYLFCEKSDKFFLVYRTLKDIESNVPITGECREDRKALSMNEEIPMNTSSANFCPSCLALIGAIVDTQFIQPNTIFIVFESPVQSSLLASRALDHNHNQST
jgi:hypothetical protein